MSTEDLTGRTRHRAETISTGWRFRAVLTLQVEYRNYDTDFSPSSTLWRDARVEDLAALAEMGSYPITRSPPKQP